MSPLSWVKVGGVVLLIALLTGCYLKYKDLVYEADRVPGLERQISELQVQHARDDTSAAKAALQILANETAAAQSERDLQKWRDLKGSLDRTLNGVITNASATKIPGCLPTANDRQLWNTAIGKLIKPGS